MTQAHFFGKFGVLRNGQDATGCSNLVVCDDHGSIVQRAILEKNVLNQTGIGVGTEHLAGMLVDGEIHILLHDDEGSGLFARHVLAGHDDGCDVFALFLV